MKATVFAVLFAASFALSTPALAQTAQEEPNRFLAAQPAAAERFEVKGMLVERHGSGARALVLVPGLATGAWVWQQVVRDFAPTHSVYVVTLPGFDGRPALDGDPFDNARAALAELIATRRLVKPVIVGHSLGGTLAIALAEDLPAQVGGVVTIDGLPVMPRTEDTPPEGRAALAESMRQRMAGQSPAAFAAYQQQYMRSIGMVDMGKGLDAAKLTGRSDPNAVANYVAAVIMRDLRPGLPKIQAPVLALAPYYAPDAPVLNNITASDKAAYYRELLAGTPKLEVATVDNARHFAMIDQPEAVSAAIRRFLDRK